MWNDLRASKDFFFFSFPPHWGNSHWWLSVRFKHIFRKCKQQMTLNVPIYNIKLIPSCNCCNTQSKFSCHIVLSMHFGKSINIFQLYDLSKLPFIARTADWSMLQHWHSQLMKTRCTGERRSLGRLLILTLKEKGCAQGTMLCNLFR